jgi:hypothetical protein
MATTANVVVTLDMRKLEEYARNIGHTADQAVEDIAQEAENQVKLNIERQKISPGKTGVGALLGSIAHEKLGECLWMVRDGVNYGIYHEFGFHPWGGTGYVPARPYMLPGVLRATKDFRIAVSEWCFNRVAT